MSIPIQDVTQVSLSQILAQQKVQKTESTGLSDNTTGLVSDQASVIRKAGQWAAEILKTGETGKMTIDWTEIDTPENAYQAAKSILKYGV
ncbi:MAG: hypothetical protein GX455_02840 [Phycisphaerae bacterium]|nr:hypothetical protein [Phycisphaerae bacterium]